MNQISKIDDQFNEAKIKRKELIIEAFAGRTQQYVGEKTGIDVFKLNRWINGTASLEDNEMETLEKFLGVDLK